MDGKMGQPLSVNILENQDFSKKSLWIKVAEKWMNNLGLKYKSEWFSHIGQ